MGGQARPDSGKIVYEPGAVLWASFHSLNPAYGPKERPVLVLSTREYNEASDNLVVAAISSGSPTSGTLIGCYAIKRWNELGDRIQMPSLVVPWIGTMVASFVVEKCGDLSESEFRDAQAKLREVIPLGA